jgi:hypothetical protein
VPFSIKTVSLTSSAMIYSGIFLFNNFIEKNSSFIKGVEFYNGGKSGFFRINVIIVF